MNSDSNKDNFLEEKNSLRLSPAVKNSNTANSNTPRVTLSSSFTSMQTSQHHSTTESKVFVKSECEKGSFCVGKDKTISSYVLCDKTKIKDWCHVIVDNWTEAFNECKRICGCGTNCGVEKEYKKKLENIDQIKKTCESFQIMSPKWYYDMGNKNTICHFYEEEKCPGVKKPSKTGRYYFYKRVPKCKERTGKCFQKEELPSECTTIYCHILGISELLQNDFPCSYI